MIKFSLRCNGEHNFDSWFKSNEAFDKLGASGLLSCPICGSSEVKKNVMTPQVQSSSTHAKEIENQPSFSAPSPPADLMMQKLRNLINTRFENVGDRFVTEVRAMNAGEIPKRSVIGDTSLNDAIELLDDGIPVVPVPWLDKRKSN